MTFTRHTFKRSFAKVCEVKVQLGTKHETFWIYLNLIYLKWLKFLLYSYEHTSKTSSSGKRHPMFSKQTIKANLCDGNVKIYRQSVGALHERLCIVLAAALHGAKQAAWEILKWLQKQAEVQINATVLLLNLLKPDQGWALGQSEGLLWHQVPSLQKHCLRNKKASRANEFGGNRTLSETLTANSPRLVGVFRSSRTNSAKGSVWKGLASGVTQVLDSVLVGSVHRSTEGGGSQTQYVQPWALTNHSTLLSF